MSAARFTPGGDAFERWRESVVTGERPTIWAGGAGELATIPLGPKLVTLIGGAPGAGKSALCGQLIVDALRLNPELRVAWCSVEMDAGVLLDRQAARVSGIPAGTIRHRRFGTEHAERLDAAFATLGDVLPRVAFVEPPFELDNIAAAADVFGARLLVLDYLQRIGVRGEDSEPRQRVTRIMDALRVFARHGVGSLVLSALARTKDARGRSSYDADGLGMASYRDSSEGEYGADFASLLYPDADDPTGRGVRLFVPKDRFGEAPREHRLHFDRAQQAFSDAEPHAATAKPSQGERRKMRQALRLAWGPAGDDAEGGDDE